MNYIGMKSLGMKLSVALLFGMGIWLTGCNRNNEPPMEIELPVNEQYLTANLEFSMSDEVTKDLIKPWANRQCVVNSLAEIPDDPFGFDESFYKINFKYNTLLLCYQVHDYNVVSYTNRYYFNTVEDTYNWTIRLGINGTINEGDERESVILSRYALLVPKLPADANVSVWFGLTDHGWVWD